MPKTPILFAPASVDVTLDGIINLGLTNAGTGTQRNVITTDGGGKLMLNATLAGVSANNLLNVVNNNIIVLGGSASQTYNGVLSGNNVWVFNNAGTTTLTGVNTVSSASSYLRQGTLVLGTGGVDTWHNDGDMLVLGSSTLSIAAMKPSTCSTRSAAPRSTSRTGATLTLDGNASQLNAGQLTGRAI